MSISVLGLKLNYYMPPQQAVRLIVSRDVEQMDMADTRRAALESLAENASDAVVAPLFWFMLLGPLGAGLYRMINTLDAMWGYRNARYHDFGYCAAKADDVVNWIPARITARLMLWLTSPSNPTGEKHWPLSHPYSEHLVPRSMCLDESYMPFAQRRALGLIPDALRIGSLTKTFCIPGLRLGYVIADAATIRTLNDWLPPWPASPLALHLLPELLAQADDRDAQVVAARQRLQGLLESADWQVQSSSASFLLTKPPSPHYA